MEPTSFSLLASLGIRVAVEAIEVDEEAAHDDLLSRLSNDPFRVNEEEFETLSFAACLRNCSKLDVLVLRSRLLEAVDSASDPPESPSSRPPLMIFCNQMAVQANGILYLPNLKKKIRENKKKII